MKARRHARAGRVAAFMYTAFVKRVISFNADHSKQFLFVLCFLDHSADKDETTCARTPARDMKFPSIVRALNTGRRYEGLQSATDTKKSASLCNVDLSSSSQRRDCHDATANMQSRKFCQHFRFAKIPGKKAYCLKKPVIAFGGRKRASTSSGCEQSQVRPSYSPCCNILVWLPTTRFRIIPRPPCAIPLRRVDLVIQEATGHPY